MGNLRAQVQRPSVRKGAWSDEEDRLLRKCIEKYGEGKWRHVPQRAGKRFLIESGVFCHSWAHCAFVDLKTSEGAERAADCVGWTISALGSTGRKKPILLLGFISSWATGNNKLWRLLALVIMTLYLFPLERFQKFHFPGLAIPCLYIHIFVFFLFLVRYISLFLNGC